MASNTKSAIVPSLPPSNAVSIDRTVNGASSPVDLASAISSAMADMRGVLINMTPDDVTVEFDANCSEERSSTRFRFRAYRRTNGTAA